MAATAAEAFTQGKTFGQANIAGNKSQINTGNASARVPSYTSSSPAEESYYMGGMGSLTAPASGQVTGCTASSTDLDAPTHGKCESVRMIMHDPGKKDMMFPLNKYSDPLVVKRNDVKSNAETYLGSMTPNGNYSGCVNRTVNGPATYVTETCDQYLTMDPPQTCYEVLNVVVNQTQGCVEGTAEFPTYLTYPSTGDTWDVASICAGGTTRVHCQSGSYSQSSTFVASPSAFTATVNDPVIGPVALGTTCHTSGGVTAVWFYYSRPVCDPNTDFCTMTMYDVTRFPEYNYTCTPPAYPDGFGGCLMWDPNSSSEIRVGDAVQSLATVHQWTQQYRRTASVVTFTDVWDNQCAALQARTH
jgi:hypothetical protein